MKQIIQGIYIIINKIDRKFYIGSAENIYSRWGKGYNKHLTNAFKKDGKENFIFSIIEKVYDNNKLLEREQHYLDTLKPWDHKIGYNKCKTAGSWKGIKHSEKSKEKMRQTRKEMVKNGKLIVSDLTKQKMSESSPKFWLGKKRDKKTKEKISQTRKENIQNGKIKPLCGENNGSILIEKEVFNIVDMYNNTILSLVAIGKEFNVCSGTIFSIINKKTWKHLDLKIEKRYIKKLSQEERCQVIEKYRSFTCTDTLEKLSKEFDVSISTICRIIKGSIHPFPNNKRRYVGDRSPNAILTWEKVRQIRQKSLKGSSYIELSSEYNISESQIHKILSNKVWKEEKK